MNFITDYQLDIDKGFMCKVNGVAYQFDFKYSTRKYLYYVSNILKLADFLEIDRSELKGIFNNETAYDVIYCDSKQQCYDLCQHIVKTYFKPADIERNTISIRCGKESYKFELKILSGKYVWKNRTDLLKHIVNKSSIDIKKVKEELNIQIYDVPNLGYLGFDSREDALKFAKWVKETLYDKQEVCEKSRRYLSKYYADDESYVIFNNVQWNLIWDQKRNMWYFHNAEHGYHTLFRQFGIKDAKEAIAIGSKLGLLVQFTTYKLEFESRHDAIKFTDYLIETYIIKKEKTYDTNQLRKERTAISRGAKPAGSIIHGRRSKASVRCGCIEHKACLGS